MSRRLNHVQSCAGDVGGCFRASFPTSAKFESEVLFDTQPEIRLISGNSQRSDFRVARVTRRFCQRREQSIRVRNCLKIVEDRKTHASAHRERKYETRSNHHLSFLIFCIHANRRLPETQTTLPRYTCWVPDQSLSYGRPLPGDYGFDPLGLSDPKAAFHQPVLVATPSHPRQMGDAWCCRRDCAGNDEGLHPGRRRWFGLRTASSRRKARTNSGRRTTTLFWIMVVLMNFINRLTDYANPGFRPKRRWVTWN